MRPSTPALRPASEVWAAASGDQDQGEHDIDDEASSDRLSRRQNTTASGLETTDLDLKAVVDPRLQARPNPARSRQVEPGPVCSRFAIQRVLGTGGMAIVHDAYDRTLNKRIALKSLHKHLVNDPDMRRRFAQEVALTARVWHPRIIDFLDADPNAPVPFIVMEKLSAGTLDDLLKKRKTLTSAEALIVAEQLASALHAMHEKNIMHRDLKPSNVLLIVADCATQVKLSDLGLACDANCRTTRQGITAGSAHYMAPEQCVGTVVDARSDVYGLGILLFQLLTGEVPFKARKLTGVMAHQLLSPAPPPSWLAPDVSADIDRIVLTALAKDPANRYASARAMGADLERALKGEAVVAGDRIATDAFPLAGVAQHERAAKLGELLHESAPE